MRVMLSKRDVGLVALGLACAIAASGCDMAMRQGNTLPIATPVAIVLPVPRTTGVPEAVRTSVEGAVSVTKVIQGAGGRQQEPGTIRPTERAGGDGTLAPSQYTDANGLPFPVPSTAANPIAWADSKTAWGADLPVTQMPALVDAGHLFKMTDVSADGKLLAGIVLPTNAPSETELVTGTLALMDVASRQITELKPYGQVIAPVSVQIDGDWVAWEYGDSILVYNRATGHQQKVTIGQPVPPYELAQDIFHAYPQNVSLDGGILVWANMTEDTADSTNIPSIVSSMDLTSGQIRVLDTGGAAPVISGKHVAWIQPDLSSYQGSVWSSAIMVMDLDSGQTETVGATMSARQLAMRGDWLAYNGQPLVMLNLSQTRRQVIAPLSDYADGVEMNDRLVTMGSLLSVWDRVQNQVVWLGASNMTPDNRYGAVTLVKGSTLAWEGVPTQLATGPGVSIARLGIVIYIVNTAQLPK